MEKEKIKRKIMGVSISEDLYMSLKEYCNKNAYIMSRWVERLIQNELKKLNSEEKQTKETNENPELQEKEHNN